MKLVSKAIVGVCCWCLRSLHSVELVKSISISCSTHAKTKTGQKGAEIGNREMSDKLRNGLHKKRLVHIHATCGLHAGLAYLLVFGVAVTAHDSAICAWSEVDYEFRLVVEADFADCA